MITLGGIADTLQYITTATGTTQCRRPREPTTARLCRVASSFTYECLGSYFTLVAGSVALFHWGDTRIFFFSSFRWCLGTPGRYEDNPLQFFPLVTLSNHLKCTIESDSSWLYLLVGT